MNFQNIKYESVKLLCKICRESTQNEIEAISYLYKNSSTHFFKNLELCKRLGLIEQRGNKLSCPNYYEDFREFIIRKLIENKLILGTLTEMLSRFKYIDKEYIYPISKQEKIVFMWERYFLNDLGLIYIQKNGLKLNNKWIELLPDKKISLNDLRKLNAKNEELGALAEKFVLDYEKEQLKKYSFLPSDCIQQISIEFANAGYDIESFNKTFAEKGIHEKIFIEVKCVNKDCQFFFTINEINRAQELGEKYYLYLVPSNFLENQLQIIRNPQVNILQNESWICEAVVMRIKEK